MKLSARAGLVVVVAACALSAAVGGAQAASGRLTVDQAIAIADAINLRHSDLPKLTAQVNPYTPAERRSDKVWNTCIGGVQDGDALTLANSPAFIGATAWDLDVFSDVEVLPSIALTDTDLHAASGPRALACSKQELQTLFDSEAGKGVTVSVHTAYVSSIVVDGVRAYRLRTTISQRLAHGARPVPVAKYGDAMGFAVGQVEVGLEYAASSVPPTATERRLLGILVKRTKANIPRA